MKKKLALKRVRSLSKFGNDIKKKLPRFYSFSACSGAGPRTNMRFLEENCMEKMPLLMTIAVLGGTGKEGKGLAYRWAKAGYKVLIGSRTPEKAVTVASEIMEMLEGSSSLVGTSNHEAAELANIVVLTVPYIAHRETLESVKDGLKGKILVDVTAPLVPPKVSKVQ